MKAALHVVCKCGTNGRPCPAVLGSVGGESFYESGRVYMVFVC